METEETTPATTTTATTNSTPAEETKQAAAANSSEPAAKETQASPSPAKTSAASIFAKQEGEASHWVDSLPEELRGSAELRKFKNSEEALKAYVNLVPMIGRKGLIAPADLNDEVAMSAYFTARRGSIENPDSYSRKYDSEALLGLDKDAYDTISAYMFANGFSDIEHAKTMDIISGLREREAERWEEQNRANYEKCKRDLMNEWGDDYESNLSKVNNFMSKFPNALKSLQTYGLENNVEMCRMILTAARGVSEASKPRDAISSQTPNELNKEIDSLMKEKSFNDPTSPGFALAQKRFNDLMQRKAHMRRQGLL